ncbi:hypothetical protein JK636_23455 [Clostridium sp. YIM B02515]|uniref:CN hydrolase domain-containing protein n=1 Tax=Clostridium rhizosphaerae TaxID=2803861 RepID=A0ABS1THH0_9CLOT|nr:hypothetical protein [Clostridium rhizosphaerae]MBL4938666.1 hypothetical protein [Clostridium rhizosphaerae]
MKVLIGQPIHENSIKQLRNEIIANREVDIVLFPEGYLSNERALEEACELARNYNVVIITSYRRDNKDSAVIINKVGEIILERAKTVPDETTELYEPLIVEYEGNTIGYILCMEILKGLRDLKRVNKHINFIAHPIGVGMFSDEQFEEWISEAKSIAKTYNTIIFGTSHADGSYRNCGASIPIAYCIDSSGEPIFISKSDTRTRIVDLYSKEVKVVK